jgi:hypothetical protein
MLGVFSAVARDTIIDVDALASRRNERAASAAWTKGPAPPTTLWRRTSRDTLGGRYHPPPPGHVSQGVGPVGLVKALSLRKTGSFCREMSYSVKQDLDLRTPGPRGKCIS